MGSTRRSRQLQPANIYTDSEYPPIVTERSCDQRTIIIHTTTTRSEFRVESGDHLESSANWHSRAFASEIASYKRHSQACSQQPEHRVNFSTSAAGIHDGLSKQETVLSNILPPSSCSATCAFHYFPDNAVGKGESPHCPNSIKTISQIFPIHLTV